MYIIIKKTIKSIFPPSIRSNLKKIRRRCKNYFSSSKNKKTTLLQLKDHLIGLGVTAGDNIIVTSSFGNLNASFSPGDLIIMLQELVTEKGLIVMPFYPKLNSYEWAERKMIFDMENTESGMGILTNVFSKMPDVHKSVHPTKAVCAWGNKAQELTSGHEISTTPYYWDSPYGRLLKMGSKSVCLGVKSIPMFHSLEDIFLPKSTTYYQPHKKNLPVRMNNKVINVSTYIHNPEIMDKMIYPGDYLMKYCPETVNRVHFGYGEIRVVDNDKLKSAVVQLFNKNITRIIQ